LTASEKKAALQHTVAVPEKKANPIPRPGLLPARQGWLVNDRIIFFALDCFSVPDTAGLKSLQSIYGVMGQSPYRHSWFPAFRGRASNESRAQAIQGLSRQ